MVTSFRIYLKLSAMFRVIFLSAIAASFAVAAPMGFDLAADLENVFVDGTHQSNFGSYEMARCVVEVPELAKHLATEEKPEDVSAFYVPDNLMRDPAIPDGS